MEVAVSDVWVEVTDDPLVDDVVLVIVCVVAVLVVDDVVCVSVVLVFVTEVVVDVTDVVVAVVVVDVNVVVTLLAVVDVSLAEVLVTVTEVLVCVFVVVVLLNVMEVTLVVVLDVGVVVGDAVTVDVAVVVGVVKHGKDTCTSSAVFAAAAATLTGSPQSSENMCASQVEIRSRYGNAVPSPVSARMLTEIRTCCDDADLVSNVISLFSAYGSVAGISGGNFDFTIRDEHDHHRCSIMPKPRSVQHQIVPKRFQRRVNKSGPAPAGHGEIAKSGFDPRRVEVVIKVKRNIRLVRVSDSRNPNPVL